MKKIVFLLLTISVGLSATVIHYSQLPEDLQRTVVPDLEGRVLISDLDAAEEIANSLNRDLPQVAAGWPVSYANSNCKNGAIYLDMDGDGEMEILFGVGTKVTALNLDGTAVPGWPVQLNYYIWSSPAAGDIDGDGEMEIVCTSRNNTNGNSGELYAFKLDGTLCAGFPVVQAGGGTNNVSLFDLDNDGDLEILVNVRNHPQGWVYIFDGDGTVYPNFPQELDYIPGAGISAGDITGDGIPEIIALSYHKLHVFDLSGNLLPGFPLENPGYTYSYSQPIIYDLDGDGLNDIIWGGCAASAGAVFAVRHDATSLPGWPQTTNYWIFGTVSLGDVDQDGAIDVVVGDQVSSGTPANQIYAWNAAGNPVAGFPAGPTNAIYAQIGIADLDGDGFVELMIDDNNFGFGYDAYNHDGTHCADWPLPCGTVWSSTTMQITPVFGDVDNDGFLEIIGAATDIMGWVVECYLWNTDTIWNEDLAYMVIDGVNIQHNGLYADTAVPPTFDPPHNVNAQVQDFNEVLITWELPGSTTEYIQHHNGYDNNGIGAGLDMQCAARFTADELSDYYDDYEISKIAVYFRDYYSSVVLKIWEGGSFGDPGTEVYSQEIIGELIENSWNVHVLPNPIPLISNNEYWIGYHLEAIGGYPASVDGGPNVADKGAWIYYGYSWVTLTSVAPMLDFNWCITGIVSPIDAENDNDEKCLGDNVSRNSRELTGYRIYRNEVQIAEITNPATLEYLDGNGLDAGDYEYYVTAVYSDPAGVSEPSNLENVTITLPAPINVTATSNWPNILIQWSAPVNFRAIESYNIYDFGSLLTSTTATFYLHANAVPGNHNYNIACVFTGGYEGEWSEDVSVTDADLTSIPIVTSLNGNYPNPFNPTTEISFSTTNTHESTRIEIYNLKGQKIKTLINEVLPAANHSVIWNGTDEFGKSISSGVYLYKMQSGEYQKTRKMILLR